MHWRTGYLAGCSWCSWLAGGCWPLAESVRDRAATGGTREDDDGERGEGGSFRGASFLCPSFGRSLVLPLVSPPLPPPHGQRHTHGPPPPRSQRQQPPPPRALPVAVLPRTSNTRILVPGGGWVGQMRLWGMAGRGTSGETMARLMNGPKASD